VKDRPAVELVDLPCFGRPARLVWHEHRWCCPDLDCEMRSWTAEDVRIAPARGAMTDRGGRWVCEQVGRLGRTVAELARELGCDCHGQRRGDRLRHGTALVEDPDRIGDVDALGLDETLFCRQGWWRTQLWSTSIVDVSAIPNCSTWFRVAAPAGQATGSRPAQGTVGPAGAIVG
jgi:transposase